MSPQLDTEILSDAAAVDRIASDWDALALSAGKPYCAPGWLMPWWGNVAPAGALLRVVVAREEGRVSGVAPYALMPWRAGLWRATLLATDLSSRVEPLGDPTALRALAAAADELAPQPARVDLAGLPSDSLWPGLVGTGHGRPSWHQRIVEVPAPTVAVDLDSLPDWLGTRSSNFRQQMRRARRKLDEAGGVFRLAVSAEEIERDLEHFERLHRARWDWRGGSDSIRPGARAMLAEAGRQMGSERFRLMSLELDGTVIGSQLFLAAGGEMTYWNGGFDDRFAAFKPSLIGLVEAIRIAIEEGYSRFDLGPGDQGYKARFSDSHDGVVWETVIPRGVRYAPARLVYAPEQVRNELSARLSPERKDTLKRVLRRNR